MRDVCYEKVIDIVDKEQVFMEHILLPGDAARIDNYTTYWRQQRF